MCLFFLDNNSKQTEFYPNALLGLIEIIAFLIGAYFFYLIYSYNYYKKLYNANLKKIALNFLLKNIFKNYNISINFYIPRRRMHRELYFEFKLFPNFIFNIKYFININNIEIIYLQGHKTSNGNKIINISSYFFQENIICFY
ncbi:MAG: hypothetical protein N2485_00230 [bacterium]|mgnify:CR=1 FL=1|nr:hypothetical protein [bacterium]